jgi:hypothetical protein
VTRLRQVALVAADLEPTVASLCETLGVEICYRDPGVAEFGLHNALVSIGDTFLEVVSPKEENTTAGRYLEKRGGDGGYMVILQCDDLDTDRKRVADLGIRVVWQIDLPDMRGTHLHPRDVGGAILSLDWADPPESWRWAGPSWEGTVRTSLSKEIAAVEVQSDDPAGMADRWSQVLGYPVSGDTIKLDGGAIRFVKDTNGRGPGVSGIDVTAADRTRAGEVKDLAGITIRFV